MDCMEDGDFSDGDASDMEELLRDQLYLTDQARYEVQKPYNCRKPHPHSCDVSREQIIAFAVLVALSSSSPGDNFSKVGGFYKNR